MGVKLAWVNIKAYRSIAGRGMGLRLGSGMNALVGPNNVGKSNVMRAIALGFGEEIDGFELDRDTPATLQWARPRITLGFRVDAPTGAEQTLLKRAKEIESQVHPDNPHYADRGQIVLRVKYSKEGRQEYFVTRGAGDRRAAEDLNQRALAQLRKSVRFVLVRSGEDLTDFLRGRFSEVLGNVLAEAQASALTAAREQRDAYVAGLLETLMKPLAERVSAELNELVPEIGTVQLVPSVPNIEETITSSEVRLTDSAVTNLESKGTGVRGGLLVAMLGYLAEHSKRSLVFAVEEPESFLHPRAQEVIREDLENLSRRKDVTLLTSTHSPNILSRADDSRVFGLEKTDDGFTNLAYELKGSEPHTDAIRGLYATALAPALLEEAGRISMPDPCLLILVVEGWTDSVYLETAAERCGREDLLEDLHLVPCEGAKHAAVQAILWKQRAVAPVRLLLDADSHGREAKKLLTKDFGFQGSDVATYRQWAPPGMEDIEAEHLFPEEVFKRFFKKVGERAMAAKTKAGNRWVYEIETRYKGQFAEFVRANASRSELDAFVVALEHVRASAPRAGDSPTQAQR